MTTYRALTDKFKDFLLGGKGTGEDDQALKHLVFESPVEREGLTHLRVGATLLALAGIVLLGQASCLCIYYHGSQVAAVAAGAIGMVGVHCLAVAGFFVHELKQRVSRRYWDL